MHEDNETSPLYGSTPEFSDIASDDVESVDVSTLDLGSAASRPAASRPGASSPAGSNAPGLSPAGTTPDASDFMNAISQNGDAADSVSSDHGAPNLGSDVG
jgi:hypothetical protein